MGILSKLLTEIDRPGAFDHASKLVLAHGFTATAVMHYAGAHIESEVDAVGSDAEALKLEHACWGGIVVWEGKYITIKTSDGEYGPEYDSEPKGLFRPPTEREWEWIKRNECPWEVLETGEVVDRE